MPSSRAALGKPSGAPAALGAHRIAFIDLEASGLGARSWPVEAGWAFVDGQGGSILIQPHESWLESAWDAEAAALHGLSLERLRREGTPVREAACALNRALEGATVYSDAPDHDGAWLYRLFAAAGISQRFRIEDLADLLESLPEAGTRALYDKAGQISPRTHRAAPDARHLLAVYRLAMDGFTEAPKTL